jgi:hypothetical protein
VKVTLETITPKKAADWYARNVNNRPLSVSFANRLAEAIAAGQWQVNGDAIRFDESGDLVDGQHRLAAVIRSGKPIKSYVIRGIESKSFDTIDKGKQRSNGDALARRGERNYNVMASCCALLFRHRTGKPLDQGKYAPRPDQMDEIISAHGDMVRWACNFAVGHRSSLIPPSELAFILAQSMAIYGKDIVSPFWKRVLEAEELKRGTAAHTLHRRLVDNKSGPSRLHKKARIAIAIKAQNAYLTGMPLRCLKYTEGEDFPEFIKPSKVIQNG